MGKDDVGSNGGKVSWSDPNIFNEGKISRLHTDKKLPQPSLRELSLWVVPYVSFLTDKLVFAEKEGDAPYRRQRYYYIEYAAYNGVAAPECPGDKVEAEDTHQTPVDAAYQQYPQCKFIHHNNSPFLIDFRYKREFIILFAVRGCLFFVQMF